jgi:hypothetical protein
MDDFDPPQKRGGRKPGQTNKHSIATMSRTVVDAIYTSLFIDGNPTAYFRELKKKQPVIYAGMVRDLMMMSAKNSGDTGGLIVNVVTLASPAVPTPGVLCSPIPEHIAPQRHLTLVHDVVDVDDIEAAGNE